MSEQAPLLGRREGRSPPELQRPAGVVEDRGGDEQVVPEPRVHLCRLPAERRDRHRVLQQPTGIVVMDSGMGRKLAQPAAESRVVEKPAHQRLQARVDDLAAQELEEAVQLVGVAAQTRGQGGGVFLGGLERANVELQAVSILVDPPENAYRVALPEIGVENLDVAPDARLDPSAPVD